jgi:hypothetical protein
MVAEQTAQLRHGRMIVRENLRVELAQGLFHLGRI